MAWCRNNNKDKRVNKVYSWVKSRTSHCWGVLAVKTNCDANWNDNTHTRFFWGPFYLFTKDLNSNSYQRSGSRDSQERNFGRTPDGKRPKVVLVTTDRNVVRLRETREPSLDNRPLYYIITGSEPNGRIFPHTLYVQRRWNKFLKPSNGTARKKSMSTVMHGAWIDLNWLNSPFNVKFQAGVTYPSWH